MPETATMFAHIGTIAELWLQYFGDTPQEQVYRDARKRGDEWGDLYNALCHLSREHGNCSTDDELVAWREQMNKAQAAVNCHSGVPEQWINEHGRDCAPFDLCRECWQPGAVDADGCGGCDKGYHPECVEAAAIRCDLRVAAYARISGDEDRAVEWERIALGRHNANVGGLNHA